MDTIIEKAKQKLRDKDLRVTAQRQAILTILIDNRGKHLSVEDMYQITRESYSDLGLATIYRTVDMFEDLGIIRKVDFGDKMARYELNEDAGHYHHHLICVECGKITEFNDDLLEELERKIAKESHFIINNHTLRFYGVCQECQEKH